MSTIRVTAEPLTIHEHPNADSLELAQVGLYRAIVGKGSYQTGEYAVYIPEQSILPPDLIEELGLTGRLAGKESNRVKAIRLRGELSQGIVCRPTQLDGTDYEKAYFNGDDFSEQLGITKWLPPIPASMNGAVEAAPLLLKWVEIENIKRYPDIFTPGEEVAITEKIHGSACLYSLCDGQEFVSSKGMGSKGLSIIEDDRNLYWRAVRQYNVKAAAEWIAKNTGAEKVGIFGEVFGQGVQDLHYGHVGKLGYAAFDVRIEKDGDKRWLNSDEALHALDGMLPVVPRVFTGPFDIDAVLALTDGKELVSGKETHMREGVVIRPVTERYSDILGGRAIAKAVSESYALRKNGTEFE